MFLGYGGQVDFIRGAAEGFDGKGKPIIALGSVNPKTKDSKIVPTIKEGKIFLYYVCTLFFDINIIQMFFYRCHSCYY